MVEGLLELPALELLEDEGGRHVDRQEEGVRAHVGARVPDPERRIPPALNLVRDEDEHRPRNEGGPQLRK